MRANLTALVLLLSLMQVCAASFGQGLTLNQKNISYGKLFFEIRKQTGYDVLVQSSDFKTSKRIDANFSNSNLETVMKQVVSGTELAYVIREKTIVIRAKEQPSLLDRAIAYFKDIDVTGKVSDEKGQPLAGANVRVKGGNKGTITDEKGYFILKGVDENATLIISYLGFEVKELKAGKELNVILSMLTGNLDEVGIVNTGYQALPKERATGSFVQIDNDLLNRRVSTNILERIDGVAPGVYFNGTAPARGIRISALTNRNPGINIRGQSTINAPSDPLIVVDNFPYEGEISNINPNDVESITILRDAAAASIWGARAGNGVIVITTKKGRFNQKMQVDLNSNVTIGNKPDLYYDKNYLTSPEYIEVERFLFGKGLFDADIANVTTQTPVSPVVALLAKQRALPATDLAGRAAIDEQINALSQLDVRKDFDKYVYQKSVNQQYSLNLRGGAENISYNLSAGFDKFSENVVRNGFDRKSINAISTYRPIKNLELTTGINYSTSRTTVGNATNVYGSNFSIGGKYANLYPYAQLADANGNALAIVKNYKPAYVESSVQKGFMDWYYRPLDEINNNQNYTDVNDILFRFTVKYQFIPELSAAVYYQNEKQLVKPYDRKTEAMYSTRDLINRFSQYNATTNTFTYIFPKGDVLTLGNYDWNSESLRGQLDFNKTINKHQINGIAGAEMRELVTEGYSRVSYGYNDQFGTAITNLNYNTSYPTNPAGSTFLTGTPGSVLGSQYRYISYYANAAYTYNERYTATLSGRKDGANIFGAKTNDKVTPLWSAGLAWNISKEEFYKLNWLPSLKLRATYGFNGNVYNGSAYLTGTYTSATFTGAPTININTPPNPELRWEKIKNINLALDFANKNNRINGSIELYQKNGLDLLQQVSLPAQTGFTSVLSNSANNRTRGIDLSIQTLNLIGDFQWTSTLLLSAIKDKLLKYDVPQTANSIQTGSASAAIKGRSLYGLYSYKWAGLDPATGDPRGYLNGQVSNNYSGIINNFNPDSLVYHGTSRPGLFGNFRNDFSYKGFSLSVNISYKFNYFIRRPSTTLNYQDILGTLQNSDYTKRWQKAGDENITDVPSLIYPSNNNRNTFYQFSEILVRKGDHIRLQDVRIGYEFPKNFIKRSPLQRLQLFTYFNNLGIVWRSNNEGLDPASYGWGTTHNLPNSFTAAFGLNAKF